MYGVLNVYLLNRFVGRFSHESVGDIYAFQYDPEYLANPAEGALSHSLPLQSDVFESEAAYGYFANLLPPAYIRKKLEKCVHISAGNVFGFLRALGGDCAGAVALYREGVRPNPPEKEILRPLEESEAVRILKSLRIRPLYADGETGYRYSGAGAQDKLIARVAEGKVILPLYGTPSTHIVKPATGDFQNSVENECFCQKLAARLGLNSSECEILVLEGDRYFVSKRYDRAMSDGRVARLHQEDFCQMLSIDPEQKYEEQGGPSAAMCMETLRDVKASPQDQIAFIDALVYNFLVGNADAHGKNYSVLYHGGRASFSPLYDVVSTAVYPQLSRAMAMSIGGVSRIDDIQRECFSRMAEEFQMSPKLVLSRLDEMARRIMPVAQNLADELSLTFLSPVYQAIIDVIAAHSSQVASGRN